MPEQDFQALAPARLDWQGRTPVAAAYGDSYFSRDQGPEESDHVFLQGNGLRERFAELPEHGRFVIGETGFGTGLNFLCAAELFLRRAPGNAQLHYLAAEKHPLTATDLAAALACWPRLAPLADELRAHYPPATPGFHRLRLAGGRLVLTLMLGEAEAMLRQLDAAVDAWFLDGFAPARNPAMWQPGLFAELARLSRAGTTLATFTAAGQVRRELADAGFGMNKCPGFASKRHMLTGTFGHGSWRPVAARPGPVTVVGAGLAGATAARALAERGHPVRVLDAAGVAAGASGNHAGVVYTTPSVHMTPQNRFYQASFLQALHWFRRHGFPRHAADGALQGVIQLPPHERGARKARQALDSGLWPPEVLQYHGEDTTGPRVRFPGGGHIAPAAWCRHLLDHPDIALEQARVRALTATDSGWRLDTDQGTHRAPQVVLANAEGARELAGLHWLPLKLIRGQVSYCRATRASSRWEQAWCHQGYLTPALAGLHCVGATFNQGDSRMAPRDEDDHRNLQALRDNLPALWRELGGAGIEVAGRRVGIRCQSRDFLPLVGPAVTADGEPLAGLYLNLAFGSRGITGTPLCAELLAALMNGEPSPVDRDLLDALLVERFIVRTARNL